MKERKAENTKITENALDLLEQRLRYKFKRKLLLKEAVTHSSYCGANTKSRILKCNERLEFLGDSVLSLIVSEYLFMTLKISEGKLSKIRSLLVCENSLYENAVKIKLGDALFLGKGEEKNGSRKRRSILANAFEAVIAAIYLDGGFEQAKIFLLRFLPDKDSLNLLKEENNAFLGDYKTFLQETIQKNSEEKITYTLVRQEGAAHDSVFYVNVTINGKIVGDGYGKSKKEAEQNAAKNALKSMEKN